MVDYQVFHGSRKQFTQQAIQILGDKKKTDPRNTLNDLNGTEWIKFLRSWYKFDALRSDLAEEKKVTIDCRQHPATFSPTMISDFIQFFTKANMKVLDPFAGIGSTLVACDRTNRLGFGVEINPSFVDIITKRTSSKQTIILGNSLEIDKIDLPQIDYCITSPPYWNMLHKIDVNQKARISKGLATKYSDSADDLGNITEYEKFLKTLLTIFDKIYYLLKPKGYLTIITQNIIDKGIMIPFAWDLAIRLTTEKKYVLKKEKIWCQDHKNLYPFGYPYAWVSNTHHHYCLIFRKE